MIFFFYLFDDDDNGGDDDDDGDNKPWLSLTRSSYSSQHIIGELSLLPLRMC